jgi:ribosomal protein S18 acetylase RimI-like enzyme
MDEPFHTRLLTTDDVPLMREMLALFGRVFDEADTYARHPPDDAYLQRLLASATFLAIVAMAGSRAVGGLAGYVLPKFEQARSEFYIYDLAVDEPCRRKGVATAMIRKLQDVAAERGIYVIFVQADLGDAPAIALYTKLGAPERVLHFDIAPEDAKSRIER